MVMNVDSAIPDDVLKEIAAVPGITASSSCRYSKTRLISEMGNGVPSSMAGEPYSRVRACFSRTDCRQGSGRLITGTHWPAYWAP